MAHNDGGGLRHEGSSSATQAVQNLLSWGNSGIDLVATNAGSGGFQSTFNLVGQDPGVVNAAVGDYRLAEGSAQINAGWPSPIAGLGTIDAADGARVIGGAVDLGAYEHFPDGLFANGFEQP